MEERITSTAPVAESPPRPPDLWVAWLRLSDFRNHARTSLTCSPGPIVLTGPNGAGKTNLLEAVSFLVPGRGLRRARLGEVGRDSDGQGAGVSWAVAAEVVTPSGRRRVGTGRDPAAEGRERRAVRVDEAPASGQQALGEILAATWLTPPMDRLFVEAPAGRRRFLDRLVQGLDPAHAGRSAAYAHALRERTRLLRQFGGADSAWLDALEWRMAGTGVAIAAARRDLVARLARAGGDSATAFPQAALDLDGDVETWLADSAALDVEERMQAALAAARDRDAEAGGAAVGPQRCDLRVRHRARGVPAAQCSTGEQKALLIALILAHARLLSAERGFAPLVLLDEVAAHLDAERRAALFEALLDLGAQAWLTGTDPGLFAVLRGRAQFLALGGAADAVRLDAAAG